MVTAERLREVLDYDPATGIFRWKLKVSRKVIVGKNAGRINKYLEIRIDRRSHLAHRLAWLYIHGTWPPNEIDHINGNKVDNRLINLRCATRSQQSANAKIKNTSKTGFKGVSYHEGRYRARITVDRKHILLGRFRTPEEAHAAYCEAAKSFFGEFARTA